MPFSVPLIRHPFAQLAYNQTLPTHTSMQTNVALVPLASSHKTLRVIDVPGHPRIRNQFQEHLATTKAIAFVVDASTISRNGPAVAECVSPWSRSNPS